MAKSSPVVRAYLLLYNLAQLSLWTYALIRALHALTTHFLQSPPHTRASAAAATVGAAVFDASHATVLRAQTLAWAEVLHALLGLAGGGVAAAFVQTLGRYVVLAFVLDALPAAARALPATAVLYVVWAAADVVRYALYALGGPARAPRPLVWLRYSAFVVLQPPGIAAEWLVYYATLPEVERVGLYRVRLPNAANFAFDFAAWNRLVLLLYFYFGPFMMAHMFRQRRAKLHPRPRPHAA